MEGHAKPCTPLEQWSNQVLLAKKREVETRDDVVNLAQDDAQFKHVLEKWLLFGQSRK